MLIRKLVLDGSSHEDAMIFADKISLKNLINHNHLGFLTGLDWNIDNGDSKCKKWYDTTYKLRNKIVHTGYEPSYFEAQEAIRIALEFREDIYKIVITLEGKYEAIAREARKFFMENAQTYAYKTLNANLSFNSEGLQRAVEAANAELIRRKIVDADQQNAGTL